MKGIALSLMLAAAIPTTCFGAAAVALENYSSNTPVYYIPGLLAGAGCYVQFYGGADAASVQPLVSTAGGNGVFSLADNPGFFDGGIGNIPGVADGNQATIVAHVWQGDAAPGAWATAWTFEAVATWTQLTGANSPPNLPTPAPLNFPAGLTLLFPEPTTWALGLIGAGMLLVFRRKPSFFGDHSLGPDC